MISSRRFSLSLIVADAFALLLLINVAADWRGLSTPEEIYFWTILPLVLLTCFALYLIDGYSPRSDMVSLDYTSQHLIATGCALLGALVLTFIVVSSIPLQSSRGVLVLSYAAFAPLSLGYRRWLYQRLRQRCGERQIVFIGSAESYAHFREFARQRGLGQAVKSCVVDEENSRRLGHELPETLDAIEDGRLPTEAIVVREVSNALPAAVTQQLIRLYLAGIPTYTLERFHQVYWRTIPLYRVNQSWLFQEGFKAARDPVYERLKRLSDILLAALGLVLASPILAIAALAVRFDGHGSAIFRQLRIGKNNQPFTIYKLRTMRPVAPGDALYTHPGDKRITRIGRVLRATRLDEFPQLWNVLRGDMSMIGPRAEWDKLVVDYETQIPSYHFRHLVRPGITGWAQVNYPYGANLDDTLRKLEYDLYYIRHFSFQMDAAIVLKTIHVMLFGRGR
jgi:exopolysaccharide biosynthesis polyprenyl glycosylphosphotransferase